MHRAIPADVRTNLIQPLKAVLDTSESLNLA